MKKIYLISLLIIIDQAFKYLTLQYHMPYTFLGFSWMFVKNKGVMLSYLNNLSPYVLVFIQSTIILIIARLELPYVCKVLILAGGASNLIDRFLHGFVIDYIHFQVFGIRWPAVINIADIYATAGLLYWLYVSHHNNLNNTGILMQGRLKSD